MPKKKLATPIIALIIIIASCTGLIALAACLITALIIIPTATQTPSPTFTNTSTSTTRPTRTPTITSRPTQTSTNTQPPTDTPAPTIAPTDTNTPIPCECTADLYNCPDFPTQTAAQACLDYCTALGLGDIHKLDKDGDGIACESTDY